MEFSPVPFLLSFKPPRRDFLLRARESLWTILQRRPEFKVNNGSPEAQADGTNDVASRKLDLRTATLEAQFKGVRAPCSVLQVVSGMVSWPYVDKELSLSHCSFVTQPWFQGGGLGVCVCARARAIMQVCVYV